MTNWFEKLPIEKAIARECMAIKKYPRYHFDIKYELKYQRNPFARLKQTTRIYAIGSGVVTYGLTPDEMPAEYYNSDMVDDFTWLVNYIPNPKIPNGSFTMIPTIWEQYDNASLLWNHDVGKLYVPKVKHELPIVMMRNVDLQKNTIGMLEFYYLSPNENSCPSTAKIVRLNLDTMSHELVNIGFEEQWDFTIDDYDHTYHDVFNTNFFRDDIGLIGAMKHG